MFAIERAGWEIGDGIRGWCEEKGCQGGWGKGREWNRREEAYFASSSAGALSLRVTCGELVLADAEVKKIARWGSAKAEKGGWRGQMRGVAEQREKTGMKGSVQHKTA